MSSFFHRKKLRLQGFDYSSYASYFLTVCAYERKHLFGCVENGSMQLNSYGNIVHHELEHLPDFYDNIHIHNFVVMPNHIHILLSIISNDLLYLEQGEIPQPNKNNISQIIRCFKAGVTRTINKNIQNNQNNKIWQKSFHDRIVRNEHEFELFYNYIISNPTKWSDDCHNPQNIKYKKWELGL